MTLQKIAPEVGQNLGRFEKTAMNGQHTSRHRAAQAPAHRISRLWSVDAQQLAS